MTVSSEGYSLLLDPTDLPENANIGAPGEMQYAMLMPFTPEGARNLRSLVVALQDPENYGRLLNLRAPQGVFLPGPEQADALIDSDAQVNQQITLWVRHGSEVMRGHTLLLPVGGDLLYAEPLWISSLQNELPQIKLVSVVYRGRTTMATSIDEAIRLLGVSEKQEQMAMSCRGSARQQMREVSEMSARLGFSVFWSYAFALLLLVFLFVILVPDADGPSPWDARAFRSGMLELFANFRFLDELADLSVVKVADVGDGFFTVDLDLISVSDRRFGWAPFYPSLGLRFDRVVAPGRAATPAGGSLRSQPWS